MKVGEGVPEGLVLTKQLARPPQQRREMLSPIKAVDEPPKAAAELCVACVHDGCCRFRTQRCEHAVDASSGGYHVAKGEARRDEAHDLLIARLIVTVDEIDRVPASSRLRIATSEQCVQAFAGTVHFAEVLAILPSQPQ